MNRETEEIYIEEAYGLSDTQKVEVDTGSVKGSVKVVQTKDLLRAFMDYDWPGNVKELDKG